MAKNKGKNKQSNKSQNVGRPQPKTSMADVMPKIEAFKSEVETSGGDDVPAADLSAEETQEEDDQYQETTASDWDAVFDNNVIDMFDNTFFCDL